MRAPGFVIVALLAVGCRRAHEDPPPAAGPPDAAAVASVRDAATDALDVLAAAPLASTKRMADADVGPLITRLSEKPGDFPSENYVTNETSLLHVAPALRDRPGPAPGRHRQGLVLPPQPRAHPRRLVPHRPAVLLGLALERAPGVVSQRAV